jgi:hypothetical protein
MKLRKPILLGVVAVIGYYLFKGAGLANVANKVKFTLRGISFSGFNMVVKVGVLNPTSTGVDFTAFVGDVLVGDKVVSTAQSFIPVRISPVSQHEISITFVPNSFGIVELITDALNKHVNSKVTIQGYANINSYTVPVKLVW